MTSTALRKHVSTLFVSREGYRVDKSSSQWRLSRNDTLSLRWAVDVLAPDVVDSLASVLAYYAINYSPSYPQNLCNQFAAFAKWTHSQTGVMRCVRVADVISYRSSLTDRSEWRLACLGAPLGKWIKMGLPGIEKGVAALFEEWSFKGARKGEAIRTSCPVRGALTDLEYESLQYGLLDAFEADRIDLDLYALATLFMGTGRRPSQMGDLKQRDFVEVSADSGLTACVLNVPRRKQRNTTWRGQFKPVALSPEIAQTVKAQIEHNRAVLLDLAPGLAVAAFEQLPLFPNWRKLRKAIKGGKLGRSELLGEVFHRTTNRLREDLNAAVACTEAHSERTGSALHVFPTRLRRTLATRAAREGYGPLVIAELLDHADDQNARVYTENVPEHIDAINAAMAMQLAPLAQAFCGVLVDQEGDAVRGKDPRSRVRTNSGVGTGTCGNFGFCGALAPIACYTCRHFQPWLDGPHTEVLADLLAERERVASQTSDMAVAAINDRTIFAVGEVIQKCSARKKELMEATTDG